MLIVHHLNESRSQRILWLLEELELPYQGKSPVISDGPRVIAESAAIVDYLIRHYGEGRVGETAATEIARIEGEIDRQLSYINERFIDCDYVMDSELMGADVQLSFVGELAAARTNCRVYPLMIAWVLRFEGRAAFRAALERGGPYPFLLK
jgi:glutathione S-transferase